MSVQVSAYFVVKRAEELHSNWTKSQHCGTIIIIDLNPIVFIKIVLASYNILTNVRERVCYSILCSIDDYFVPKFNNNSQTKNELCIE